jgi:hypothetical protein
MTRSIPILTAALLGSLALACARTHLSRSHGESYDAAFSQQRAVVKPAAKKSALGLDSQEAEIIADGYRRSLAPKALKPTEEPVIYVAPPAAYQRPPALPPSVPKEAR